MTTASTDKVTLSGGSGAFNATILAPTREIVLSGGSTIYGAIYGGGKKITLSGASEMHYTVSFSCGGGGGGGGDPDPADPVADFIDDFAASGLGRFGWYSTGGTVDLSGWDAGIYGNVGVGPGTLMNYSKGFITGDFVVDPTVTEKNGSVDNVPGATVGTPISSTVEDLSSYKAAAFALSAQARGLTATQTFGQIKETTTISSTAPNGLNVIAVETIDLGSGRTFTIDGGADDYFIFNISKDLKFSGAALVISGVPGSHILFNLVGAGTGAVKVGGVNLNLDATILAPTHPVDLTGTATVTGSIISGGTGKLSGQATITQTSPFGL